MTQQTPQPGRFRRLLGLKRVLIANLAVFAVIAWGFSGEFLRNREMQKEIDSLQTEASGLENKNAELADTSARASSRGVLEQEARTKLNLRKPGEEVVVVSPGPGHEGADATPVRPEAKDEPRSNPARWWHYFFR
ncbi:MAG TPA: septum formation initiator family protein [Candidatus Binatia bacterium]|jgi:cell division protein FtsB|nr:septum formation initiator family protein [Candidatus Binatia bacterium]